MRLGIFYGPEAPHVDYLEQGAASAGWECESNRISEDYKDRHFDAVVVGGHLHRHNRLNGRILYYYQARGVPVFVVEMARMLRPELPELTYWFFYLNGSPSQPMGTDSDIAQKRAKELFPAIRFTKRRGSKILVVGQDIMPDARLHAVTLPQLKESTGRKLIWRPRIEHSNHQSAACDEASLKNSLEDDIDRSWCAVTYNSNVGGQALARGVPVICHPSATYAHLGEFDPRLIEKLKRPKKADVEAYFRAMAMITWSNQEMRDGDVLEWFAQTGQIQSGKTSVSIARDESEHNVVALTCTGGRQMAFEQTEKYLKRQTLQPAAWLIVDDCEPETKMNDVGIKTHVIRPRPAWKNGMETYARNFRCACEYIQKKLPDAEWVAVFEDDDWYHKDYLDFLIPALAARFPEGIRMGGEFSNIYYHVRHRKWHRVGMGGKSATMASTVFHVEFIPELLKAIDGYEGMSLDLMFYRNISPKKFVLYDTDNVIGMKGLPCQRAGGSHTHKQDVSWWDDDADLSVLHFYIGPDADFYGQFYRKPTDRDPGQRLSSAQLSKLTPSQRRYAKLRAKIKAERGK